MKEPDPTTWDDFKTRLLPGDLVKTEHGLAIICEAQGDEFGASYSVWNMPGWKWKSECGGAVMTPARDAWYCEREVELVKCGPASLIRLGHLRPILNPPCLPPNNP